MSYTYQLPPNPTPLQVWLASLNQDTREGTASNYVLSAFRSIANRDPTASEAAQVLPYFLGGDPNKIDVVTGNGAVASIFSSEQVGGFAATGTPPPQNTASITQADITRAQIDAAGEVLTSQNPLPAAPPSNSGSTFYWLAAAAGLLFFFGRKLI